MCTHYLRVILLHPLSNHFALDLQAFGRLLRVARPHGAAGSAGLTTVQTSKARFGHGRFDFFAQQRRAANYKRWKIERTKGSQGQKLIGNGNNE